MKKFLLLLATLTLILTACGKETVSGGQEKVKLGIRGSDTRIWDFIKPIAEKEGIEIEIVKFSDYVLPNNALAEGEIDANAFQTVTYFNDFKKKHQQNLTAVGTTNIAPMGIYSKKIKDISELKDGDKVALPNDSTNLGRALLLLKKAGLLELKEGFNGNGGLENITENPKKLKLTPVVPAQTPRALDDVTISIINNGIALDAGFKPVKDAIFIEDGKNAKPYINIIATQTKNKDNPSIKKLVEIYQSKEVKAFIEKTFEGSLIPTVVDVKELENL